MPDGTAPIAVDDVTSMLGIDVCQRWRGGRASYRPAGEPIDAGRYGVELVDRDNPAKRFVEAHHYSGTFPAARLRVGLYRGREMVGVCVFAVPGQRATIPHYTTAADGVVLGRLVLLDDVPANGESWFVARALRALRAELPAVGAVVSYSDPVVRTTRTGERVKPGHVGTVYQALNALYVGRSRRETVTLDDGGRVVDRRMLSKLRNDEQGAAYAYERLRAAGAPRRRPLEEGPAYIRRALEGFRRFRHPGNHTYVWLIGDGVELEPTLAKDRREHPEKYRYPKASS